MFDGTLVNSQLYNSMSVNIKITNVTLLYLCSHSSVEDSSLLGYGTMLIGIYGSY